MLSLVTPRALQNGTRTIITKLSQQGKLLRNQRRTLCKFPQKLVNRKLPLQSATQLPQSQLMSSTRVHTKPAIEEQESVLSLELGSETLDLPYLWLRDHCRCDTCYNHSTNQKNLLAQDLDSDIRPSQVTLADDLLTLTWPDGHVTSYTLPWLQINSFPGPREEKVKKVLWDASTLSPQSLPRVELEQLMAEGDNDQGLKELVTSLLTYGIGLVTGVPADVQGTQRAVEKLCFIQRTMYGDMWSFTADGSRGDTAYTNIALGAHTDSTYMSTPTGLQIFHCVFHDGTGGETLLVDGFKAAEEVRANNPKAFHILTTQRLYHENAEADHHLRSLDPIIKVHPVTQELEVIRYNQYDRAPMSTVEPSRVAEVYSAIAEIGRQIQKPEGELWLKLQPGTVIFIDNWRVLHGRAAFTGNRSLNGCYLPRDDWIGKARKLDLIWS